MAIKQRNTKLRLRQAKNNMHLKMILPEQHFFAEESIIRHMSDFQQGRIRQCLYKVSAHTSGTVVLVFQADKLFNIMKGENNSFDELIRSYEMKLPNKTNRNQTYSDLYKKVF